MLNLASMIPAPNVPSNQEDYIQSLQCTPIDDDDHTVITLNMSTSTQDDNSTQTDTDDEHTVITSNTSTGTQDNISLPQRQAYIHTVPPTTSKTEPVIPSMVQDLCALSAHIPVPKPRSPQPVQMALSDSGATGHFLVDGAPAINIQPTQNPIHILLPNGNRIQSTHTCNLDIPWLPNHVTEAHIVSGLSHSSLISTRKFCAAGYKVIFGEDECRIYKDDTLVLVGDKDPSTQPWRLSINPAVMPTPAPTTTALDLHLYPGQSTTHLACNVYTITHKQNQMKYMHQSFLNAPIPTILKAITKGHLQGIPLMKTELITKHLTRSPATSKGRMKRPRTGIRSTRKKVPKRPTRVPTATPLVAINDIRQYMTTKLPKQLDPVPNNGDTQPVHHIPDDYESCDGANNLFCYSAFKGTLYTDATGALPARSLDGNQYYFVVYDYDTNYIFAIPLKDMTNTSIIEGFDTVFSQMKEKGHKPKFNVTDNQASTAIKAYLKAQDCAYQFVEPSNHRVNAAERAIQTYKNHFISGLCSTDEQWPIQLWDQLTTQATITLNLL